MQIQDLQHKIQNLSTTEQLFFLAETFKDKIAFSTSFGQEDQIITDFIFKNNISIKVFTLDTGRLFAETYKVWNKTLETYNKPIVTYYPNNKEAEKMLTEKGPFSFYESIENRKECCDIRKVNPLTHALAGIDLWITGLRAEQSEARAELPFFTYDDKFKVIKFNPLKDWTIQQVTEYIDKNNIPQNSLHENGFISIGCQPCTRAIAKGEDIRAGRWWWEDKSKKECGLHVTQQTNPTIQFGKLKD